MSTTITVACVGKDLSTRSYLTGLFRESGFEAKSFDRITKAPKGAAIIMSVKRSDWLKLADYFEPAKGLSSHLVFVLSGATGRAFVNQAKSFWERFAGETEVDLARTPEDAVAIILKAMAAGSTFGRVVEHSPLPKSRPRVRPTTAPALPTAAVPQALRDAHGNLNAQLVKKAFALDTMAELAKAARITRQALDENPSTPAVIPLLEKFENIAQIRTLKQLERPDAFCAWWKKRLPALGHQSPYERFLADKIDEVVSLVDSVLTGEPRG